MTIEYKIKLVRAVTFAIVSLTLYVWAAVKGN